MSLLDTLYPVKRPGGRILSVIKLSPTLLGKFAWFIVRMLAKTLSIEVIREGNVDDDGREPRIYALWHGRIFLPLYHYRNCGIHALVSEHRDGDIITATLEASGHTPVRGSTTRGGARALVQLIRLVGKGKQVAFTPDGPRGPKWHFQPGAVYVAAKTGIPIIPLTGSAQRAVYFKSWDAFQLPLPFSKCLFMVGEPYHVTGDMTDENIEFHRAEIERRMTDLVRKADREMGLRTAETRQR